MLPRWQKAALLLLLPALYAFLWWYTRNALIVSFVVASNTFTALFSYYQTRGGQK